MCTITDLSTVSYFADTLFSMSTLFSWRKATLYTSFAFFHPQQIFIYGTNINMAIIFRKFS